MKMKFLLIVCLFNQIYGDEHQNNGHGHFSPEEQRILFHELETKCRHSKYKIWGTLGGFAVLHGGGAKLLMDNMPGIESGTKTVMEKLSKLPLGGVGGLMAKIGVSIGAIATLEAAILWALLTQDGIYNEQYKIALQWAFHNGK